METIQNDNNTQTQQVYILEYQVNGCKFDLKINDMILVGHDKDLSISSKSVLNAYLHDGENQFEIILRGKNPNECSFKLTLFSIDPRDKLAENRTIISEHEATDSLKKVFTIDSGFGNPIYESGETIEDSEVNLKKLLTKYEEIHKLLLKKNVDEFMRITKKRNEDWAVALFKTSEEHEKEVRNHMERMVNDFHIQSLDHEYIKMGIYAHAKLANLQYEGNYPIIYFANKDKSNFEVIPLYFYFNADINDFIVVR